MKPKRKLLLIVVAVLIAASLAATYYRRHSRTEAGTKRKTLEAICAELPVYPDFHAAALDTFSKDLLASLGKPYNSRARYHDVRAFYVEKLTAMGWQLTQETDDKYFWRRPAERQLTFQKGDYSIVIKYRRDKASESDWDYAIEIYEPVLGFDVAA